MKTSNELKFWRKAKKLIRKGYGGHHCKAVNWDYRCPGCWSGMAISWIDSHLDLLIWKDKNKL